jgi:hypothetical protein
MKSIKAGDVLWMDKFGELINVVFCADRPTPLIYYWSDAYPEEAGTKKCRYADAWIIFKYGVKVGSTGSRQAPDATPRGEK